MIAKQKSFPYDKSLIELGLMDSFGVIEVITYLEKKYKISVDDDEITKEKFGSFNKIVNLTFNKIKSGTKVFDQKILEEWNSKMHILKTSII